MRAPAVVRTLAEAHQAALGAVPHAEDAQPRLVAAPEPPSPSCARCGAPASTRPGARFCSAACRQAVVRDRRASARADLLVALDQLAEVTRRVESALKTLGLNPQRPARTGAPP